MVGSHIGQQTSDNLVLPGTDSQRATDILTARFPQQANGTNPVAMRAPSGKKLSDQQQKDAIDNVVDAYKKDHGVQKVVSPFSSDGAGQLTKDGTIGYISLTLKDDPSELTATRRSSLIDVADPVEGRGDQGRRRRLPGPEGLQAELAHVGGRRASSRPSSSCCSRSAAPSRWACRSSPRSSASSAG